MKGQLCSDEERFPQELHQDREFEIFTAIEGVPKTESKPILYSASNNYDNNSKPVELLRDNEQHRGIWFTANSMMFGKRKVEFISSYNAMALDLDSGKEGDDRGKIEKGKKQNISHLLSLQLPPTVINETKNGLQPYWFLHPNEIKDNAEYVSLQQMMQQKLGADPGAIGGERLYRLPGFYHWKDNDDPFLIKIVHADFTKRYSLKELVHKYGGQKKHKKLTKKNVSCNFSGKPISIDGFSKEGDIGNLPVGCQALKRIENDKAPRHSERLALLSMYANLGNEGLEHFRKIAKHWNDYNEPMTEYMIRHTVKQGYKPMTCKTLIAKGICKKRCVNILDKQSPIAFYFNSLPTLPMRFDQRQFIDATTLPNVGDYAKIENKLEKRFKKYNQTMSDQHKQIFQTAAEVMALRAPNEKPIVLPIIPGGGKTNFIVEYLRYMTRADLSFGAVLVVERQETIREIAKEINLRWFCGADSFTYEIPTAYPMLGYADDCCLKGYNTYKPSQCKTCDVSFNDCRVKYNFAKQKQFPVVVISHARLFDMSDRDDALENLRYWEERIQIGPDKFEIIKHPRKLLIIDEKPKLVDNVATDNTMWDQLIADAKIYAPDYVDEVKSAVDLVRDNYSMPDEHDIVAPVDEHFRWSKDFIDHWKDDYLGDYPEYPMFLRRIITEGGLYSREDKNAVCLTHYSNTYWGDYNTVILDGTALTDPDYRDDRFLFWNVPHLRPYHNLTIHVCMEQNLSKSFYKKNDGFIAKFCKDIDDIAADGKTYVVAYKGYEEQFNSLLKDNDNVRLEHWGNTKGRNDMRDCKKIVCAGLLHKGETYYHSKDIAVQGVRSDERSFQCNTVGRVRRFNDLNTESTKVYEFIAELIQDIFRTGLRNHYSNDPIDVYLSVRDINLINLLESFFTGCVIDREWKPTAFYSEREAFRQFVAEHEAEHNTNAKLVKAYIDDGHELTSEDVSDVLEISKDNAGKMLRRINK